MRDLGIGGFCRALRQHGRRQQAKRRKRYGKSDKHWNLLHACILTLDAAARWRFPPDQAPQIRRTTIWVIRSQRLPSNGNVFVSAGPSCLSSSARNKPRARCNRVFTVSGSKPKRSAVSSTLIPSTRRATKTARKESGSS